MDAYDRCTNLGGKNLADIVAIYGRGRELFRPPTYIKRNKKHVIQFVWPGCVKINKIYWLWRWLLRATSKL